MMMVAKKDGSYDFPKALNTYVLGKAMADSKAHASVGIEDATADQLWDVAIKWDEETLEEAFNDLNVWMQTGHNGGPQDIESMQVPMSAICSFTGDVQTSSM